MALMRDFGDDVFAGAAKYYAKYRPAYPPALFDELVRLFELNAQGNLLDLGCGTGELAVPLAKYFNKVLAIDPDAGMLAEGRKKARQAGSKNIRWQQGSSKELNRLDGPFRLVAMGQSFHWMEQRPTLRELYRLTSVGGGIAIIGTEPLKQSAQATRMDEATRKLIIKYLGPRRRASDKFYTHPTERYEDLLPDSDFVDFGQHYYDVKLSRSVPQIVGHLFSMSWANPRLFGDGLNDFKAEITRDLSAISVDGKISETIRFSLYTARR